MYPLDPPLPDRRDFRLDHAFAQSGQARDLVDPVAAKVEARDAHLVAEFLLMGPAQGTGRATAAHTRLFGSQFVKRRILH